MADRRKEREEKLRRLKDGTLRGKPKADFQFKMAKILERELNRLEELSLLLDATPDNYLKNIDFKKMALAAMSLTQKLIAQTGHAPIIKENDKYYVTKTYMLTSFPGLPELNNSVLLLSVRYEPLDEDLIFARQLAGFLTVLNTIINDPLDHQPHSMEEYNSAIASRLRSRSKTGKFSIVQQPMIVSPQSATEKDQPPK
jgi:hypothetical protein